MHELGIMYHVVKTVLGVVEANNLTTVETLVLEIGEQSPVVPRFVVACYPAAVDGTLLQDTRLKIERIPGNAFNIREIIAY